MLTINNNSINIIDNWKEQEHTQLENTFVLIIKRLLDKVYSNSDLEDIKRSFPILWGN